MNIIDAITPGDEEFVDVIDKPFARQILRVMRRVESEINAAGWDQPSNLFALRTAGVITPSSQGPMGLDLVGWEMDAMPFFSDMSAGLHPGYVLVGLANSAATREMEVEVSDCTVGWVLVTEAWGLTQKPSGLSVTVEMRTFYGIDRLDHFYQVDRIRGGGRAAKATGLTRDSSNVGPTDGYLVEALRYFADTFFHANRLRWNDWCDSVPAHRVEGLPRM